jgi:hypothetical protein
MTIVEMLDEPTDCDLCGRELVAGDLVAVGHVPIPFCGGGGLDWVPVISECARCAGIPNGFHAGWNLYDVTEENLRELAERNLQEDTAVFDGSPEVASAIRKIARIREYLQRRNNELLVDTLPRQLRFAPRRIVHPD